MKVFRFAVLGVGLAALAVVAMADEKGAPKASSDQLKTVKGKASYGVGFKLGEKLKMQATELDPEALSQGIRDALTDKSSLTEKEIDEAMTAFQQELQAKKAKEGEEMAKKGVAFLAENKKKAGVTTLPSGLQYKVLKEGTGKTPKATDTATVNYEGKLIDGTVFDSSAKNGGPAEFQVGRVIPGFSEALKMMKVGSKWQIYIPSDLAYGATPPTPKIPPNSPLIFDLEVIDTKPGLAPAPGGAAIP